MNEADPHEVEWTAAAARALERLPEKVAAAAVELIYGALAGNPHGVGRPLRFELEGRHSARRGDYRVVHRIDDELRVIVIEVIAHRADVYRRRSPSSRGVEADLRDLALVLARTATDDGRRTSLDDAIAAFGFDRSELERQLDADLAVRRD